MKKDGLENVRKEPVMVPKWVRGRESLDLVEPVRQPLPMLGLGNSVGTPARRHRGRRHRASRTSTSSTARAADVKGRIVLFNVPFTNYGETVAYRRDGPVARGGARRGRRCCCARSGPTGLRTPHTGAHRLRRPARRRFRRRRFRPRTPTGFSACRIAACRIRVRLSMEAHFEPDAQSYNVVGELRGRELPNEIVVVGGHFDSWDVGAGASDDGGGCVVTWEALRLMKKLNLRPRRTVRVVLFTNEENGGRGGNGYRDAHRAELANHVAAARVRRRRVRSGRLRLHAARTGARATVTAIASLLKSLGADPILAAGGGADIEPSGRAGNIPMMSHVVERRLLPDPPHAGRHDRAHHAEADVGQRGGDRGDDVRGRGSAVEAGQREVRLERLEVTADSARRAAGSEVRRLTRALLASTRVDEVIRALAVLCVRREPIEVRRPAARITTTIALAGQAAAGALGGARAEVAVERAVEVHDERRLPPARAGRVRLRRSTRPSSRP